MEPTEVNLEQGSQTPSFYTWEVPGKPVAVQLDFDVVDRMLLEVMRGFGAVPRRGAEVGGILLGRIEPGEPVVVRVQDFEPVACEHARGPSYLLSDQDRRRFEEAVRRWAPGADRGLYAVGCYRSHTRDGLALGEEDLAHFNTYFPDPSSVYLLVKPFATRVSVGGFFFRELGEVHSQSSYQEFPFRRRELGGGAAPAERAEPRPRAEPPPAAAPPESADKPAEDGPPQPVSYLKLLGGGQSARLARKPAPDHPRRNLWVPISFIFLLLGVLLGFQAALTLRQPFARPQSQSLTISLSVAKSGDNLLLRWDRQSPAIENAQSGLLTITDGSYKSSVPLDASQLRRESVVYRNMTNEVDFRFEVNVNNGLTLIEKVGYRGPPPGESRR